MIESEGWTHPHSLSLGSGHAQKTNNVTQAGGFESADLETEISHVSNSVVHAYIMELS